MSKINKPVILLLVILTFVAGMAASQAGNFLVVSQTPVRSDVILVFAGDAGARTTKAIELYKQGYANKIVLSGGPLYMHVTEARLMYDHAVSEGVAPEDIIMDEEATSTCENALNCRKIMEANHFNSALVISSEYHMFRVKRVCEKVFAGSSYSLVYCASRDPVYDPGRWWANNRSLIWTVNEYIKLAGYELGLAI